MEPDIEDVVNSIICGDCRDRIACHIPDSSIDLIYLDPPFFSSKGYNLIWGENDSKATIEAFEDAALYKKICGKCGRSWRVNPNTNKYYETCVDGCDGRLKDTTSSPMNTPEIFTEWLKDAIKECHRTLKHTGSIYVHLDWHVVHYVKVMMDEIFNVYGQDATKTNGEFLNDIIWGYSGRENPKQRMFARKHDTILFYAKSNKHVFNTQFKPYRKEYIEQFFKYDDNDRKGRYQTQPDGKGGRYKQYLSKSKGHPINDVWDDIRPLSNLGSQHERLGYDTQKPEALLARVISASSNEDDIVLDPFCGCGTTVTVSQKLKRRWIGIDIEPLSCTVMQTRMYNVFKIHVPLVDLEKTLTEDEAVAIVQQSHKMNPFDFQDWVVKVLGGKPNNIKSGDGGIDGWIVKPFGVLTKGDPIQVKMSAKVGDPVVKLFAFNTMNEGRDHGVIVAYSFSKTAEKTAIYIKEQHGIDIWLMTVRDMLIMTSKKIVDSSKKQLTGMQGELF